MVTLRIFEVISHKLTVPEYILVGIMHINWPVIV